jgi:hypothetical protein
LCRAAQKRLLRLPSVGQTAINCAEEPEICRMNLDRFDIAILEALQRDAV